VRGKGRFMLTEYVPTDEKVNSRYPLLLTTGRILSQYNVGARPGAPPTLPGTRTAWRSTRPTPRAGASTTATGSASAAAPGRRAARAVTERVQPGVVYTTFHFPESGPT
jgi:formate dehydrogenase major subunit